MDRKFPKDFQEWWKNHGHKIAPHLEDEFLTCWDVAVNGTWELADQDIETAERRAEAAERELESDCKPLMLKAIDQAEQWLKRVEAAEARVKEAEVLIEEAGYILEDSMWHGDGTSPRKGWLARAAEWRANGVVDNEAIPPGPPGAIANQNSQTDGG